MPGTGQPDDVLGRLARLEARMDAHDYRLTREVDIAGNERGRLSLAIEKLTTIVERQEDRTDKLELRFAQVFAIIALLVFVANIVGPFVVNWLTSGRLP